MMMLSTQDSTHSEHVISLAILAARMMMKDAC